MTEERRESGDSEDRPEPEQTEDRSQETSEDKGGLPPAPSIGAGTEIEHIPPQERLAGHEHTTEDAMGLDKHRQVTGETYGPTRTRVIMRFVVFFAIVAVAFVGLLLLVGQLDKPPETNEDVAPWSASDAPQSKPQELQ